MTSHYKTRLVSGILIRESKVLLGFRLNTKVYANCWSLPVGHVEPKESDLQALERELYEELGIINLIVLPFCQLTDDAESIFHQVYLVKNWIGKIENKEPSLCARLEWFRNDSLPMSLTPVSKDILSRSTF